MDIFDVWEVLRVEGGKTFKVFVAFAQPDTYGHRSFTGFGQSTKSKAKVAFWGFYSSGAGTNFDSALFGNRHGYSTWPNPNPKKIPEHDFEIRLQILREKLEKEVCAPFGGTYGTELVLL